MSDTSESSPKVHLHSDKPDIVRDLALWRRKQLNVVILLAATATWTVMEVYQYNFLTLLSWVAMALVACFFFWGNVHRLLKREAPELSELEIREGTAIGTANLLRQRVEEGIQLMFHVSAEREWFVFAGVVACLYLISVVARHLDFLTVSYIGLLGGMTIPVIYVKYECKIREFGENLRNKSKRFYGIAAERLQKMKNKIAGHQKEIKDKKMSS